MVLMICAYGVLKASLLNTSVYSVLQAYVQVGFLMFFGSLLVALCFSPAVLSVRVSASMKAFKKHAEGWKLLHQRPNYSLDVESMSSGSTRDTDNIDGIANRQRDLLCVHCIDSILSEGRI